MAAILSRPQCVNERCATRRLPDKIEAMAAMRKENMAAGPATFFATSPATTYMPVPQQLPTPNEMRSKVVRQRSKPPWFGSELSSSTLVWPTMVLVRSSRCLNFSRSSAVAAWVDTILSFISPTFPENWSMVAIDHGQGRPQTHLQGGKDRCQIGWIYQSNLTDHIMHLCIFLFWMVHCGI